MSTFQLPWFICKVSSLEKRFPESMSGRKDGGSLTIFLMQLFGGIDSKICLIPFWKLYRKHKKQIHRSLTHLLSLLPSTVWRSHSPFPMELWKFFKAFKYDSKSRVLYNKDSGAHWQPSSGMKVLLTMFKDKCLEAEYWLFHDVARWHRIHGPARQLWCILSQSTFVFHPIMASCCFPYVPKRDLPQMVWY